MRRTTTIAIAAMAAIGFLGAGSPANANTIHTTVSDTRVIDEAALKWSEAVCEFTADFKTEPGVTPRAGFAAFETVEDAPVHCTGEVNGSKVIAEEPGSYKEWGWTYGDCTSGNGIGGYEAVIPTEDGMQRVSGWYRLWYNVGETGGSGGEKGLNLDAEFEFVPTEGSCTHEDPMTGFQLDQISRIRTFGSGHGASILPAETRS